MKNRIVLLVLVGFMYAGCEKEYINPYDRAIDPDSWKPKSVSAIKTKEEIQLTWQQQEKHIQGFRLEKKENGNDWQSLNTGLLPASANSFVDTGAYFGQQIQYRVQAVADLNQSNFAYSQLLNIPFEIPKVETGCPDSVGLTSLAIHGNLVHNGGLEILESGYVISESSYPTISNSSKFIFKLVDKSMNGVVDQLKENTSYHLRAYATNAEGTGYGSDLIIATPYQNAEVFDELAKYMPVYYGNNPPDISGTYTFDPVMMVYDASYDYKPGETFGALEIVFNNESICKDFCTLESYDQSKSYHFRSTLFIVQGSGNNFSCFIKEEGHVEDIPVTFISIFSGTIISSGIKDLYHGWCLESKGDDSNYPLTEEGTIRVFKDGEGLSPRIQTNKSEVITKLIGYSTISRSN